jgi:glycosyltransferase involved in cell wall biosynthesis
MAEAVIKIFSDEKLYRKLRLNAIRFAKSNTWENEYK